MSEPFISEDTIATNEWWWVGGILSQMFILHFRNITDQTGERFDHRTYVRSDSYTIVMRRSPTLKLVSGEPWASSETPEVYRVVVTGQEKSTHIAVTEDSQFKGLWKDQLWELQRMYGEIKRIKQLAIGAAFEEILDEYYAYQAQGKRVKLRDLAEERRVNYASLRQAKIRYDAKRRNNETHEGKNASDD